MARQLRGALEALARRLLRETRGAATGEWALGAAVLVAVGAASLSGISGGVEQAVRSIDTGLSLEGEAKEAGHRMRDDFGQQEKLRRQQERAEQLRRELEERQDRSAWDDFSRWFFGDDGGAEEVESPAASRLEVHSKWLPGPDDD